MPGQWDDSLKIFVSENPQDFASWLLGEAQVKLKLLNVEAATLALFAMDKINRRIDTDYDVPTVNG